MATGFASALSEGQPAQIDLGEEAVPCLVVGFIGADVMLAPSAPDPARRDAADRPDRLPADRGRRQPAGAQGAHPPGPEPRASSSPRCSTRSASASAATSAARRSCCPRTCARPAPPRSRRPPSPATSAPAACASPSSRRYIEADLHEVVIGLVQANREIRAMAETVRVTDADVSLSFTDIERRGPAPARPADLRVPPAPRRLVPAIRSAQFSDWEETHGWFGSGHYDRERR